MPPFPPAPIHSSSRTRGFVLFGITCLAAGCLSSAGGDDTTDPFDLNQLALTGPDIRIGSVDDSAFAFTSVTGLDVMADGRILTFHSQEQMIRRWTPDGQPDGTIGGRGEGPGEFQNVFLFGVLRDTVWTFDFQAYRTTRFDSRGQLLGTTSLTVNLGERGTAPNDLPARPGRPFSDGTYYGSAPGFSNAIATGELTSSSHVRFNADGEVIDTIWRQEWRTNDVLALLREGGGSYGQQPFGDQPILSMLDDGLVVLDRRTPASATGAAIRVTRLSMTGDTLFSTEIGFQPEALPQSRVDSAVTVTAERMLPFMQRFQEGLTLPALSNDIREATFVPAWMPVADAMTVTEDGEIWIRQRAPRPEGRAWWVLGTDGRPRGTIITPDGLRVLKVRGDEVYGIETDDFDVNYIVRYGIHSPAT